MSHRASLAYGNNLKIVHGAALAALVPVAIGYPLEEPRNLVTGLITMYRPSPRMVIVGMQ
jgi:hypothetical protein